MFSCLARSPCLPVTLALVALLAALVTASTQAQDAGAQISPISGDPGNPRRHFRLRNPASLEPEQAEIIYRQIAAALANGYQRGGIDRVSGYQSWNRYNTAPYISKTHGNKYLNNYVNDIGRAYGSFESAGEMPVGTVIAKDSFTMTQSREILLGPLFVMEKMADGFNTVTGDWKYTQIQPDGTLLGETGGRDSDQVRYCIGCHNAVAAQDHLYFLPKAYRPAEAGN